MMPPCSARFALWDCLENLDTGDRISAIAKVVPEDEEIELGEGNGE
jgi:hypothetical protein